MMDLLIERFRKFVAEVEAEEELIHDGENPDDDEDRKTIRS